MLGGVPPGSVPSDAMVPAEPVGPVGATSRPEPTGSPPSSGARTTSVKRAIGAPTGTLRSVALAGRPGTPRSSRSAAPAEQARMTRSVTTTSSAPSGTGSSDGVGPRRVGAIPTLQVAESRPCSPPAGRSHWAPIRVRTLPPPASIASRNASVSRNNPPSTAASTLRPPAPSRRARRCSSTAVAAAPSEPSSAVARRSPGTTTSAARSSGPAEWMPATIGRTRRFRTPAPIRAVMKEARSAGSSRPVPTVPGSSASCAARRAAASPMMPTTSGASGFAGIPR